MSEDPGATTTQDAARRWERGRILVAVYGVFALAATGRAGEQIALKWHEAPLAFSLSAFSALVYCLATVALVRRGEVWRRLAWSAVLVELVGVLVVGTVSLLLPQDFPRATVWSGYGVGYVFVPLVLPFVGLWWLRRARAASEATATTASPGSR
jgi:hypothetical protein